MIASLLVGAKNHGWTHDGVIVVSNDYYDTLTLCEH